MGSSEGPRKSICVQGATQLPTRREVQQAYGAVQKSLRENTTDLSHEALAEKSDTPKSARKAAVAHDQAVARAFGAVLREVRNARGLTQEDLAAEADVDRTYPSLLERGHRLPTLGVYFRLCQALRCAPADLMAATVEGLARLGVPAALTVDAIPLVSTHSADALAPQAPPNRPGLR